MHACMKLVLLASSFFATITCVRKKTTSIGELPRFELRAPYRPGVSAPHRSEKVASPAAGALSPPLLQISTEKMSDKRRRKRLGSGDSEGSEDSEGTGGVGGGEGKEEKEGASSDPERDEGVVS